MDANGAMFWHEKTPSKDNRGIFGGNGGEIAYASLLVAILPSFTPPPLKPGEIVWNPKCKPANESE